MRRAAALFALSLELTPAMAPAQDDAQTLADIRQELQFLRVELQRLTRELSTTGSPGVVVQGDILQRVDLIESELQRMTAKTEELQFRIDGVVSDGTNRIGDIEFRICEIDPACDLSQLGRPAPLGGATLPPAVTPPPQPGVGETEMAVGEQADFNRARAAFDAGDFAGAATQFQAFSQTYLGGPLTGEAHYWRGRAMEAQGNTTEAARAYLESFSGTPSGEMASDALLRLGLSLDQLGQRSEACLTLGQVPVRYPGSAPAAEAADARLRLSCP